MIVAENSDVMELDYSPMDDQKCDDGEDMDTVDLSYYVKGDCPWSGVQVLHWYA